MLRSPRSHVTLRPDAIEFPEGDLVPMERTYERDYATENVLGEGGMGRVFAGRDKNLGRRVAIKELHPDARGKAELWGRFVREAQIGGQLEHPNIVPIYSFEFSPSGGPAFVMQLIEGESLADYIARAQEAVARDESNAPTLKDRIAKLLPVCDAIAYAHGRGVLHRDLKPENVMLGAHNVVLVTDWGIARVEGDLDDESLRPTALPDAPGVKVDDRAMTMPHVRDHISGNWQPVDSNRPTIEATSAHAFAPTLTPVGPNALDRREPPSSSPVKTALGVVMGTPEYMSPEQAAGAVVTTASDQYSLGLMLLELATLSPARSRESTQAAYAEAVLGQHRMHDSHSERNLDPRLAAIVHRATAKAPSARYPSVDAFARDLRAYTRDEEVSVLPDSAARKFLRHLQLHPARSVATAALILLALAVWSVLSTSRAASRADAARRDAETLSHLTGALLGEGRAIEQHLGGLDAELVGLTQIVRMQLEAKSAAPADRAENRAPVDAKLVDDAEDIVTPERVDAGLVEGLAKNPVDGRVRSYRTPVVLLPSGAGPELTREAHAITRAKRDIIDLFVASIDEKARRLSTEQQETLMRNERNGLVRLMIALESGVFAQFPARSGFPVDFDARRTDWYRAAIRTSGSTFVRPRYGPAGKYPRLALVRPMLSRGRVLGAASADLWLAPLVERLGVHADKRLVRAFVAAPDGVELASQAVVDRASADGGTPEAPIALPEVSSAALRRVLGQKRQSGYLVDGPRLFIYTRLAVADWVLVHEYRRAQLLELIH